MSIKSKWTDLGPRLLSALVMVAVGAAALWQGGVAFVLLVAAVAGLMIWELVRILGPKQPGAPVQLGLLSAVVMAALSYLPVIVHLPMLAAPLLVGASMVATGSAGIWMAYGAVVLLGSYSALVIMGGHGLFWLGWLVSVVVMSDIAGYFAGRLLGGPKFWPKVSPKKTWSGTIAGWVGAGIIGALFAMNSPAGLGLIVLSVITAFAAQMGDIAESAIKRRFGIKDSSNLIPGHGGFLDRFDGMLGALLLVLVAGHLLQILPGVG
jgi:phosphatidate cytidylyltransferase